MYSLFKCHIIIIIHHSKTQLVSNEPLKNEAKVN